MRLNPLRPQGEAALEGALGDPVPWEPWGRYTLPGFKPGEHLAHPRGPFTARRPAPWPRPGIIAPAGRAGTGFVRRAGRQIGAAGGHAGGRGALVSNEPDFPRPNFAGQPGKVGRSGGGGGLRPAPAAGPALAAAFDAVLVDAPCSGEGMFRRDPQARAEWSPQRAAGCARRQRDILAQAAAMVRPEGGWPIPPAPSTPKRIGKTSPGF